jgi:hypothetical protein
VRPPDGGATTTGDGGVALVRFSDLFKTVLNTATCSASNCHGGSAPQEGLQFSKDVNTAYNTLKAKNAFRAGNPDNSLLIQTLEHRVVASKKYMPKDLPALSTAEIKRFRDWISQGALNN